MHVINKCIKCTDPYEWRGIACPALTPLCAARAHGPVSTQLQLHDILNLRLERVLLWYKYIQLIGLISQHDFRVASPISISISIHSDCE